MAKCFDKVIAFFFLPLADVDSCGFEKEPSELIPHVDWVSHQDGIPLFVTVTILVNQIQAVSCRILQHSLLKRVVTEFER